MPDAREAVLAELHRRYPDASMTVVLPAGTLRIPIFSRGMARIVNADALLKAYAAAHPEVKATIRLHDPLIKENNHIWVLDRGEALVNDGFGGRLDLDVTQDVLLAILSSDRSIGEVFNLPTQRPYISMMHD